MTIKYAFDQHGGFIAVDTNSRLTSYAYYTSHDSTEAQRNPQAIADKMIAEQSWRTTESHPNLADYDARNFSSLSKIEAEATVVAMVARADAIIAQGAL